MSYVVRLRPEADRDVAVAASWYEQQRPGLGQEFLDEFVAMSDRLSESPLVYPTVHRKTCRALLNRFPFGVFFRMAGTDVVIVAVMHGSRSPHRWRGRE
jgi:plasmid stabilization system protein ParE